MSQQQIVPGWYPDPAQPDHVRYHDGRQWTQHVARRTLDTGRPALSAGWYALGKVLIGLFVAVALMGAVGTWHHLNSAQTIDSWLRDPTNTSISAAETMDQRTLLLGVIGLALSAILLAVYITWHYLAYRSRALDPTYLPFDPAWVIGSWFVPFLNLVRPPQLLQAVHRAATSGRNTLLVPVWWATFLCARLLTLVSGWIAPNDTAPGFDAYFSALSNAYKVGLVADAFSLIAAGTGIALVYKITSVVSATPDQSPTPRT